MFYFRLSIAITVIVIASGSLPIFAALLAEGVCAEGKCRAVLSVSPGQPFLADTIVLTIDVICPDGDVAIFPPFGETLGELNIVDIRRTDRQLILTTTPRYAGTTPIWAMTIRCGERQVEIPGTELTIATTIDSAHASLDNIGLTTDILPEPSWHIYAIIIAALILAILLFLGLLYRRKGAEVSEEINPLSAQEEALQRLADLLESRKHEADIKGFFVELSDIVRWYVERLTGIRAPELTTEEFLHRIARSSTPQWAARQWGGLEQGRLEHQQTFTPPTRSNGSLESLASLAPFLEAADSVKFAKHIPTDDEIMLAFRRAEQFVVSSQKSGVSSQNTGVRIQKE